VVEEETGLLVPAREHAALARALGRYLAEPALRAEHGQAARVRVLREFDQRRIWEALRAEYLALLTARGQALPAERETGPLAPRDVPAFG
jgi:glycosyltransferase involved in cell wall biosynthesis